MTSSSHHIDAKPVPAPGRCALFDVDTRIPSAVDRRLVFSPRVASIQPKLQQLLDFGRRHALPVVATTCLGVLRELRKAQMAQGGACALPTDGSACPYAVPIIDCLDAGAAYIPVNGCGSRQNNPHVSREIFLERRGCATPEENVQTCAFDAFLSNPHAADVIGGLAIHRWAVFGLALEYCVKAAAQGLLKLDYEVVVLVDAVIPSAHSSPATVEDTYRDLQQQGARLITVQEFLGGKAWHGDST